MVNSIYSWDKAQGIFNLCVVAMIIKLWIHTLNEASMSLASNLTGYSELNEHRKVDTWNAANRPGVEVNVRLDSGEVRETQNYL